MPVTRKQTGQKQNFLQGALILSLATVAVKIIGACFKIPIQNLLNADGSTHFQVAYSIYSTLFVLSTAGLPVAVSKMVSEAEAANRWQDSQRIFRTAFLTFMVIGLFSSMAMFFGAPWFAVLMNDAKAVAAIRAISPAIFFVTLICPYRGYHQGKGNMIPTALSQIVEALGKLVFGLLLTWWIVSAEGTVELQAAGAIGGVTIGTLLAAVFLMLTGKEKNRISVSPPPQTGRSDGILRQLLLIAVPITLSAAVLSLTNLVDTSMVLGRLKASGIFTEATAEHYYGAYTWSMTLFNLPPAFILTLSVSIIPAIAAAIANKNRKQAAQTIQSSFRVTSLLALPAAAGLISLAWPILNLLYPNQSEEILTDGFIVPGAVTIAAPLLSTLGVAILFVCLVSLTNAILQAMGMVNIPLFTMLAGAVVKIICNFALVGNPKLNINGAPIGTIICYGLIASLNMLIISRVSRLGVGMLSAFVKPLAASVAMGFIARGIYFLFEQLVGAKVAVILAMVMGVLSYGILIVLLRALHKEDIMLIPKGEKIVKILKIN